MKFVKMHGAGNDYVYVDCLHQAAVHDPPALAVAMSDRHRGIGADGLILIERSDIADARMRMWNADGTPAEMCGNGLRCVGKYLFDRGIVNGRHMRVETGTGVLNVRVESRADAAPASRVRVEMGEPVLQVERIPVSLSCPAALDVELPLPPDSAHLFRNAGCAGWERSMVRVNCVSMGNPHCVVFVDALHDELVRDGGALLERHPAFPRRTNVEWVRVLSRECIAMRVWERGCGETQACGTGACAAVVAASLTNRTRRRVQCRLPGGVLDVAWSETGIVYLTGPAVEVFEGTWPATHGSASPHPGGLRSRVIHPQHHHQHPYQQPQPHEHQHHQQQSAGPRFPATKARTGR